VFKKILLAEILTLSIFLFGVFLGIIVSKKPTTNKPVSTVSFGNVTPAPINNNTKEEGIYNVALFGYGGVGHEGSLLTDSIIIIHVNTNTKVANMISIPRDLWVPGNEKINAAGITGFQNTMPVLTNITGLPINYYVSVNFGGFTKLIDNLGGITVNVPKTFDDPFYPILGQENNTCGFSEVQIFEFKNKFQGFELEKQFACRYEHLHFNAGVTNLDGETALKFVRSRHGDSDFGRSLRQFAVLQGIGQKLITLRSMNKVNETVSTLFQLVKTDLDLGTIKSLLEVLGEPNAYKVNEIQLSTDNVLTSTTSSDKQSILIPKSGNFNFSEIKSYIKSKL